MLNDSNDDLTPLTRRLPGSFGMTVLINWLRSCTTPLSASLPIEIVEFEDNSLGGPSTTFMLSLVGQAVYVYEKTTLCGGPL